MVKEKRGGEGRVSKSGPGEIHFAVCLERKGKRPREM